MSLALLPFQALAGGVGTAAAVAPPPLVGDPASLVNPLIGTSGEVDTFPGPDMPFGMLQWGPDTTPHRPDGGGYEYKDGKISGFSLTHVSGPGCPAGGDVPILPTSGPLTGSLSDTAAPFGHAAEHTGIGYYGVTDTTGVTTELTTATRSGLGRFTFPAGKDGNLLLKLSGGATRVDGTRARIVNDHEITGAVNSGHFCGAANTYTLHFDIKFDRPFRAKGTWVGGTVNPGATSLRQGRPRQQERTAQRAVAGPHLTLPDRPQPTVHGAPAPRTISPPVTGANGVYVSFDTVKSRTVTAAVGISYTTDAAAGLNLAKEIRGFDFAKVRKANHDAWNAVLRRVRIGGGSHDQQVKFYTALYHALLHPNVFSDVDGGYAGMDGQVHKVSRGQQAQYATYSGWDTYRSQTQLMALVAPRTASDVVTSELNGFDQTGLLPKWAHNNGESYVMAGDPGAAIIADAYAFGARDFNARHALDAMVYQATKPNNDRPGEAVRDAMGYLPIDGRNWGCCNFYGPVSTQLEYDSADHALAAMARSLGHKDVYTRFATRAQDWQNVFNPQTGYLQAKLADGEFAPGFAPGTSNGFIEGTSAQYTPMVPFNLKALIAARGGPGAYSAYLDGLLSNIAHPTGVNADLSNEPSLEIPWEYDYLGKPWKTQAAVRQAQLQLYFNAPVGSFGNDDLGAMSSWYVFSELGMYPQVPGEDTLVLGSPGFPRAEVALQGGRTLRINAPQAADDAPYVHRLTVNGRTWDRPWLSYASLRGGATLDYTLGTRPDTSWAAAPRSAPPSDATGQHDVLAAAGPSGVGLVVAPGASGTGRLTLTDIGPRAVTVRWQAHPPAGVSVDAASGTVRVPAGGSADVPVKVTAGHDEGVYPVPFTLTTDSGADLGPAVLRVVVAGPGELWPYYTGEGVYPDGARFTGGFDGGGWAYSQDALKASGVTSGSKLTVNGIGYTWPTVASGRLDNIAAAGQTIPANGPAGATRLGLLGAGTSTPTTGAAGELTITYTDGSTGKAPVVFSDWTLNAGRSKPAAGNTVAVTTPYRNTGDGSQDKVTTDVFAVEVPLAAGKQVASLTLPAAASGTIHLFAVGYGG
ncbi:MULTISPECIES: lectin [Streptomycetaceae]|uniref:Alpha-1,2-mannosidase n=1 Tax=Streptantibioticus cattleyicolor (strain ATCC 35852 / DSM 46488 / JCM 4925 / NBRC 14057 / NRRL 8057) TaxID=1003195 RepID=F8JRR9_STREN